MFSKGIVLYTRTLMPRTGVELTAVGGDSYAAIAVGPATLEVELRHVTEQSLSPGARGLCGAEAPSYVAIARDRAQEEITVMAFAGEEPPGPRATRSRMCGAFRYAPPDGARTRQGVLLE